MMLLDVIIDASSDMTDDRDSFLSINLQFAAGYYPSVSELCRRLEINRQQFMRYLSGKSYPSRNSLRRICDFLGVDEFELLLPPDQFRKIIALRPVQSSNLPPVLNAIPKILDQSLRQRAILMRIVGYYYEYYLSFSTPGHVLRALTHVYTSGEYTLYKRIERLRKSDTKTPPDVYKYDGVVAVSGDRIYMFDQEAIVGAELSQTILFVNSRNRISALSGLRMGVAGSDAHEPSASRTVMEYVGRTVNKREALSACQLYRIDSREIPTSIRAHLTAEGRIASPLRGAII